MSYLFSVEYQLYRAELNHGGETWNVPGIERDEKNETSKGSMIKNKLFDFTYSYLFSLLPFYTFIVILTIVVIVLFCFFFFFFETNSLIDIVIRPFENSAFCHRRTSSRFAVVGRKHKDRS